MNDKTPYQDPVLVTYANLIKANTDVFKKIYFGDPLRIPASNLPALIISKRATNAQTYDNAEDQHNMTLVFTVVTDIRKDIRDDNTLAFGVNTLYDIVEGRDAATLALKPTSLLQILRHSVDANSGLQLWTDINTQSKIDYGMTMGKRAPDGWSLEAMLTVMVSFIQLR